MGNSPASNLAPYNGDQAYSVVLGDSATIHFTGRQVICHAVRGTADVWKMSYKVHNLTSKFYLTKTIKRGDLYDDDLYISNIVDISIPGYNEPETFGIRMTWQRDEADLLHSSFRALRTKGSFESLRDFHKDRVNSITKNNAWGGITETSIGLHEHGRNRFMLVTECKKRSKSDEKPYMLSVTHYYASLENGKDVGLSVQVKRIKAASCEDEGRLDFTVAGPHLHPAHALFYMYDEIVRTRKPTCCPHCANNIVQSLRMSCPSETEDSDDVDAFVLPYHRRQNVRGGGGGSIVLDNGGRVRGNYNGNLNIRNFFLRPR